MGTAKKRSPRLGRGLSSLMSSPVPVQPEAVESNADTATQQEAVVDKPVSEVSGGSGSGLVHVPVADLEPNRHQPRQVFEEAGLARLAESIKREGVMQPIVARQIKSGAYEIVAGERRWRAAQLAGLASIPTMVKDLNDQQIAEWALVENLQREDLNPIERAEAFSRLIDQFGLSHEEAGQRVGMDRSSITNHLRLLTLAQPVQQLIQEGLLSMGQARALAGLSDAGQQVMLAQRAVRDGMSVRDVEAAVRKLSGGENEQPKPGKATRSAYLADLENQLSEQLGTKVGIKAGRKKGSGTLSIDFYSLEQFDALVGRMGIQTD